MEGMMSERSEHPKDGEPAGSTGDGGAALVGGLLVAGGLLYAAYQGLRSMTSQNQASQNQARPNTVGPVSSEWEECLLYVDAQTHTVATQGVVIGGVPYYDRSSGPSYTEWFVIVRKTRPDVHEIYRSGGILEASSVHRAIASKVSELRAQGWEPTEHDSNAYRYQFRRRAR
jgi:hypothetical protein